MATFKTVIIKCNARKDSTHNINIRVTHNRKSKYINTGFVATKDDITKKGFKLKNHFFIDETEKMIGKYRDICNKNALALKDMEIGQVFDLVTKTEKPDSFYLDIVGYGRKQVEILLKNGRKGTASNLQSALNNLVKFVGCEQVDVNKITAKFIMEWIEWIDGVRAKATYPSNIRKLHNGAKREYNIEELGIIKIPLSPFSVVKLPKEPKAKDIDIPVEKVRELFNLAYKDTRKDISTYNLALDMFMLSFCLWGTNAVDFYECTDYKDGRITYNRAKTKSRRDDEAKISIKVEPEIMPLIEKYRDKTGKRVFCFYQKYSDKIAFNTAIGNGLRKIRDEIGIDYLVYYSARHSFATIAINDADISEYTVHKMLNHVIEEMKITEKYVRKDWRPLDRANRKLLDFVFEKQTITS